MTHKYEYEMPLAMQGSIEDVFAALTTGDALKKWFAEHVDVDARPGGAFRFWGKHTYGVPAENEANQTITDYEPPKQLSFNWQLLGQNSQVTWQLREDEGENGKGIKIKVIHEFDQLPDMHRAEALIDDLWRLTTGNLLCHMNSLDSFFLPDYNDDDPEVRCETVINAPVSAVFAALITPESIKDWFGAPAPFVDPQVGGDYGMGFSFEMDGETVEPPPMKILEFVENERLAITWPDWRSDSNVPDQKVTWILREEGDKTHLTLIHDGFTRTTDVSDYPFGWAYFMGEISRVAEA